VVGFWKRLPRAAIDFFVISAGRDADHVHRQQGPNVHLPAKNIKLLDIDMWIDLVLAGSSAL
jgi:hypothetical protein